MRVVAAGLCEPAEALALDEAVVRAEPQSPVLILWRTRPAVVIGRFQRADWEIDAAACAARGVRVWRRFTGGGAVHLDPGTLCASGWSPRRAIRTPRSASPISTPRSSTGSSPPAARSASTRPATSARCASRGRKVTGVAAHRGRRATLVHGTLLVDADLESLVACLAGPRGGSLDGRPRPAHSRPDHVANVGVGMDAAHAAVVEAFAGKGAAGEPPSPRELELAAGLRRERYGDRAWHGGPWHDVTSEEVSAVLGEEAPP